MSILRRKKIFTPRFFQSAGWVWTRTKLSPILMNVSMLMVVYGVIGGFGLGLISISYISECTYADGYTRNYWRVWTRANISPISVNVPMLMVVYGVIGGFGLGLIYLLY